MSGQTVTLPRDLVTRAARALCVRACCDSLGVLRGEHEAYCLVPALSDDAPALKIAQVSHHASSPSSDRGSAAVPLLLAVCVLLGLAGLWVTG